MGLSTSQLRDVWDPPCNSGSFITISLHGEGRVTVDPRTTEAVTRLNDILIAWDYRTRSADTGAYNCRQITGGSGYSLHAYGIALDINWQSNPYGPNLITDMPRGMVDEITALRTGNGQRVWEWGGNWSGNKDAMHYEIDCSPADLATGIQGGAKPPPIDVPQYLGAKNMFLIIHGVGCYAFINGVEFMFKDWYSFQESVDASTGIPTMVIGEKESGESRLHLNEQLFMQHVESVGG
jgi:D-alanyl-D-alanine carboxypeptidase